MFKVLIVEDEMLVRLGIKCSIDWAKFDMNVIADVGNGLAAWEVYKKERPDLIITDIRMPVMDGIQLIEKIRAEENKTKFIILSCLEEFQYARKALALGVLDYILKLTMSHEEMESVLEKVRNILVKDNLHETAPGNAISNLNISKDNIISDYLFYGIYSENRFAELVKSLDLYITPEKLMVCAMEIDHFDVLQSKFKDEQGKLIRFSILNAVNELLESHHRGVVCHAREQQFILIFSFSDLNNELEIKEILSGILGHIRRALKSYFDASVTFGISRISNGYSALKALYEEGDKAASCKYLIGAGTDIGFVETASNDVMIKNAVIKLEHLHKEYPQLNSGSNEPWNTDGVVFTGTSNEIRERLLKLFYKWGHKALMSSEYHTGDISGLAVNFSRLIGECETLDESIYTLIEYIHEISKTNTAKKCYSKEVVSVIRYIQENYHENITVQDIADIVGLSPNYLSGLFKNEFGSGLIEYITQLRIEKAKELLMHTNMKSYEIAEKIGFSDESYFSRTFKRITGLRPNEFKRQWI